jgi:hypothetical protein
LSTAWLGRAATSPVISDNATTLSSKRLDLIKKG